MSDHFVDGSIGQERRDQMLKLVSKGFYRELINYGVQREEIIRVASHLLDNLMSNPRLNGRAGEYYDSLFAIPDVNDRWQASQEIEVRGVCLRPLKASSLAQIDDWLNRPGMKELFVPPYPDTSDDRRRHFFESADTSYFSITWQGKVVGMIGGEKIDPVSRKLEMKKLVGEPDCRGKGVGKLATFAFLYHAFRVLGMHKVYVHSRDINLRNINLNSKFGFILEGIFLEDLQVGSRFQDVVRMALFEAFWSEIFSEVKAGQARSS